MKLPFYIHTKEPMSKRWRLFGILLVAVLLAATLAFWTTLEETNINLSSSRLSEDKDLVIDAMEQRLEVYSDVLYGGRALFLINPELPREDWDTYMMSQNLFERYPGLNSVSYLEVANETTMGSVYDSINAQRKLEEQAVSPLPGTITEKMAIAKYATPINGYRVVGRNGYDREYLQKTLDRAAIAAVPIASPPFASPNENRQNSQDVIIFLAVYDRTFRNDMSSDQKQDVLKGYIAASIHPATLLTQGVNSFNDPESVAVRVSTVDDDIVYEYGSDLNGNRISQRSAVDVAGQTWFVDISAPATYDLSTRQILAPGFFLVAGFIFMMILVNLYFYWTGVRFSRTKPTPKRLK